jgi:hypothetical protein
VTAAASMSVVQKVSLILAESSVSMLQLFGLVFCWSIILGPWAQPYWKSYADIVVASGYCF